MPESRRLRKSWINTKLRTCAVQREYQDIVSKLKNKTRRIPTDHRFRGFFADAGISFFSSFGVSVAAAFALASFVEQHSPHMTYSNDLGR
mmetsp:Transcript_9992/g.37082  ORF Transcript_9992/g.37082 Transcript_9992/m.37082 type:complete len:90 (-) Transcript_9992:2819-3088(-)